MAELSVIIILALGAISTAGWSILLLARLAPTDAEDLRLKRALQSAANGLARRQFKLVAGAFSIQAAAGLALLTWISGGFSWWLSLGLLTGTAAVFVLSLLSVTLSLHSASATGRLVGSGDQAVALGLRSASALILISGASSVLLGAGALAAVRLAELKATVSLLEGMVIGGLSTSLLLQSTGSSLRVAGITSRATIAGASKQPFYCLDSNNPSLVLDLVAQHTGGPQGYVQRVFCVLSLQQILALVLARGAVDSSVALLSTVLLTQAASLVCSGVIQLALRTSDGVRTWTAALSHGLLASSILTLVALVGASYWLLGEPPRLAHVLVAGTGAALTWLAVVFPLRRSAHQNRRLEDHQENQRRPALDLGFALPEALGGIAVQLVGVSFSLLGLAYLAPAEDGIHTALWWWCTGALVTFPYVTAQGLLEPLTEAAASLAALRLDTGRPEPQAQLSALCAVGQQSGSASQRWFAVCSAIISILALGCISDPGARSTTLVSHVVAGLLGVALVVSVVGVVARRASTTSLVGVNEVARHQRSEGENSGKPGYAQYVEVVTAHALHRGVWLWGSVFVAIWVMVTGTVHLHALATDTAFSPPTTFLAFAATTGITVSLLGVGISSFVGVTRGFRRAAVGPTSSQVSDSLNTAQLGLAELVGSGLAPAALVLVHLLLVITLAVTPSLP